MSLDIDPLTMIGPVPADATLPSPDTVLGFPLGQRAARVNEIERCLAAWAGSPRLHAFVLGRTPEDLPLHIAVVTCEDRIARHRADDFLSWREHYASRMRSADPADDLPGVVWLGYGLHGSEMSGPDAALAVIYQLLTRDDDEVKALLRDNVLVFCPAMNPDGRRRHWQQIAQWGDDHAALDAQDLRHTGSWPRGSFNHYLFDLNRDWLFLTQPETQQLAPHIASWWPALLIDAHEFGAGRGYLFSPSREPIHPRYAPHIREAWKTFARDHADRFDTYGWSYYTGEWLEDWYPGYTTSWAAFLGAVPIIHEQARVSAESIALPSGHTQSYREAVARQVVSSWVNLQTFARERQVLVEATRAARRPPADGPAGYFLPGSQEDYALAGIVAALRRHGLEVTWTGAHGGGWWVDRQQEAWRFADVLLDPQTELPAAFLAEEKLALTQGRPSHLYDVTAWNLAWLAGRRVEVLATAPAAPDADTAVSRKPRQVIKSPAGWVFPGDDDRCLAAAYALQRLGVHTRGARAPFNLDGMAFARGSVVVLPEDNDATVADSVAAVAAELHIASVPLATGLARDVADPDLGGDFFRRLQPARAAVMAGAPFRETQVGDVWHYAREVLRTRLSLLDPFPALTHDLSRYDALILPDSFEDPHVPAPGVLKDWVQAGGTLIAWGRPAAAFIAREGQTLGIVTRAEALNDFAAYRQTVRADLLARSPGDPATPLEPAAVPDQLDFDPGAEASLQAWRERFAPCGTQLRARVAPWHFLTAPLADELVVMARGGPSWWTREPAEAPVRLGVPGADGVAELLAGGLLWPEAEPLLRHAAWLVRAPWGRGQVILFADSPFFRGVAWGTARLLGNALVFGPACGRPFRFA